MSPRVLATAAPSALLVSLVVLLGAPAPARAHQLSPDQLRQVRFDQRLGAQVPPDLVFSDESGQPIPLRRFFAGRPLLLTLNYFHCPNLCTVQLEGLADRLRGLPLSLGAQYTVVTVSVDPRETPADATAKKAEVVRGLPDASADDWHFLTGDQPAIQRLAAAVGDHYLYDPQEDEYVHPVGLIVLTPGGQVSRYIYGLDFTPTDLRLALVEAGQGRVGSLVDRALLLCYHYDPITGRYTSLILTATRLLGLGTLLVVGLVLGTLWRDDLRRQRAHSETVH